MQDCHNDFQQFSEVGSWSGHSSCAEKNILKEYCTAGVTGLTLRNENHDPRFDDIFIANFQT